MRKLLLITILLGFVVFLSCKDDNPLPDDIDVRQEMRDLVIGISTYSKSINSDFIIIPQNGQALITDNGEVSGNLNTAYVNAIDATGREDLFYGFDGDNKETPLDDNLHMYGLCELYKLNDVKVLVTDYCSDQQYVDNSYYENYQAGFISFAADQRELNNIPAYPNPIYNENADNVLNVGDAMNFLYLINPENYSTKSEMLNAIAATNYDLVIIDLYFDDYAFTAQEIAQIKSKQNGGQRKIVAYMSIGEAEDYRYYWNSDWNSNKPDWLEKENSAWRGNYKVRYWEQEWKDIIYGNETSYVKQIIDAGFDGVYLDIIDGYEYFESEY